MNSAIITKLEPKQFYRKLENLFSDLEMVSPPTMFAPHFAREFCKHFAEHLAVESLFAVDTLNDDPDILYRWGKNHLITDEFVSKIRTVELPWVGEWKENVAASFSIGEDPGILISVLFESSGEADKPAFCAHIYSLFSSLHYTLGQYIKRQELQDVFEQARAIQMSLLPPRELQFGPFEIAAATVPAHSVGGDVFDFHPLNAESLSIAIADASGHGLPAALQARDVIVGLRMGLELENDIAHIVCKLNRVIYRNGLASRFASLLFGTLDVSGKFHYVNAGHPRPLLLNGNGFHELEASNMILGPYADTSYAAATILLPPNSHLALYTDGVLEHSNPGGVEFGTYELRRWMADSQDKSVESAIQDLYIRLHSFGQGRPFRDDATAVLIRHRS